MMRPVGVLAHVTGVEVVGRHRLHLTFQDGAEGSVDFSRWNWRGVEEWLADPANFAQVSVDEQLGTIVWPNGSDMPSDTLRGWIDSSSPPPA